MLVFYFVACFGTQPLSYYTEANTSNHRMEVGNKIQGTKVPKQWAPPHAKKIIERETRQVAPKSKINQERNKPRTMNAPNQRQINRYEISSRLLETHTYRHALVPSAQCTSTATGMCLQENHFTHWVSKTPINMPHGDFRCCGSFINEGLNPPHTPKQCIITILVWYSDVCGLLLFGGGLQLIFAPTYSYLPIAGFEPLIQDDTNASFECLLRFTGGLLCILGLILFSVRWNTINGKLPGLTFILSGANTVYAAYLMDNSTFVLRPFHIYAGILVSAGLSIMFRANKTFKELGWTPPKNN